MLFQADPGMTPLREIEHYLAVTEQLCNYSWSPYGQHTIEVTFAKDGPEYAPPWCTGRSAENKYTVGVNTKHHYRLPPDWAERIWTAGWSYLHGMVVIDAKPEPRLAQRLEVDQVVRVRLAVESNAYKIYPMDAFAVEFGGVWTVHRSATKGRDELVALFTNMLRDGHGHHDKTKIPPGYRPFERRDWRAEALGKPTARNRGLR